MTEPRAMVDVVGADSAANELLENVVILVADARRGDAGDCVGAVLCFNFIEAPGDIGDRLVPARLFERGVFAAAG